MVVVTGRDYRANLAKYYSLAQKGEDVVVKARYGSWKVVPITEDDIVVNKRDLPKELRNALQEVKESMEGKKKLMTWEERRKRRQAPFRGSLSTPLKLFPIP